MQTKKIGDLNLGKIDAKNEVLRSEERDVFELSFLVPPNFPIKAFETYKKSIVEGPKGTGKTALLRYLETKEKKANNHTSFILFKSEFTEADKSGIGADSSVTVANIVPGNAGVTDASMHWRLYLHALIAQRLAIVDGVFQQTVDLQNYLNLFKGGSNRTFEFKKGTASIDLSVNPKATLQVDFGLAENDRRPLSELVGRADSLYKKLWPLNKKSLCIFIDELELTALDGARRLRDAALVRDLILACEIFIRANAERQYPVHLFVAIRSDVVSLASSTGTEINKIVQDHGARISWSQSIQQDDMHSLLQLVSRRLQVATDQHPSKDKYWETWNRFFPSIVDGKNATSYLLHQTWYKPRDLIRLLVTCAESNPNEISFSERALLAMRKEYSRKCWDELAEELSLKYDQSGISGIKQLLTGAQVTFSVNDLASRLREKRAIYPQIDSLVQRGFTATAIAHDLYRVGAIGNITTSGEYLRWSFRGDDEPLLEETFRLHDALRPVFSANFSKAR